MITAEGLSKRYRMGERGPVYSRLTDEVIARLSPKGDDRANRRGDWVWALRDVSFQLDAGTSLGVIGRNGAGKSTLLKILTRITPPTEGSAVIEGRVGSLLEVGTGFHPELTGRENIYLNGSVLGMPRREVERRFDEIVEFSEVGGFIDTPVKRYSSGMYVRLAFAIAAHLDTDVLLLDEVLAVGDAGFQRKCLDKMSEVTSSGRTIVFVSHDLGAIGSMCDRAIVLSAGQLVFDGQASEAVRHYLAGGHHHMDPDRPGFTVNTDVLKQDQETGFGFTDLHITNPRSPALGPCTGQPLDITLHYRARRRFVEGGVYVRIRTLLGLEVARFSTMPLSGYPMRDVEGPGRVSLRIDRLPLTGGRYILDVGFTRPNVDFIVTLEDAARFDVEAQDIYGSGVRPDQRHGVVVADHRWTHESEPT